MKIIDRLRPHICQAYRFAARDLRAHHGEEKIMKHLIIAVAVLIGMTSPAFAKHCPKDAKIIDQSMREAFGSIW